jgi:isochorismate synthase
MPGSTVVIKTGEFELFESLESLEGFIVSDFKGEQFYHFKEFSSEPSYTFLDSIAPSITKEEYLKTGEDFLAEIRSDHLGKAVLSRVKTSRFDSRKVEELFHLLESTYPDAFVYLISSSHFGTWIGATPEKLIQSIDGSFVTMSLAGTLPADSFQSWGEKEMDEQQQVTDFISDVLQKYGSERIQLTGPFEVRSGAVKHLRTDIQFELNPSKLIELARELHPTPAVSGMPRNKALKLIRKYEKHERGLYAGMIGFISGSKCSMYVNLRCCSIHEKHAALYVGGGFTKDSVVLNEWDETENKSRTLLNLMDLLSI